MLSKEEFNSLSVAEQITLVNKHLSEGLSLLDIFQKENKKIDLSESTFRSRAKKLGYALDKKTNQYIVSEGTVHKNIQKVSSSIPKNMHKTSSNIVHKNIHKVYFKQSEDFRELVSLKDDIKNMIQWFKKERNVIDELRIDENLIEEEVEAKTFRVYKSVLKNFLNFAKRNKQFKQQDLVSMALKEFLERYSD